MMNSEAYVVADKAFEVPPSPSNPENVDWLFFYLEGVSGSLASQVCIAPSVRFNKADTLYT
jgi:hypothetical protein